MVVKNFVFRENWVGSKVAGMKTSFFAICDPTWTQIRDSSNSILVKKDRNYIIITFVTLRLTNQSAILENNQFFANSDPNWAKIWP